MHVHDTIRDVMFMFVSQSEMLLQISLCQLIG